MKWYAAAAGICFIAIVYSASINTDNKSGSQVTEKVAYYEHKADDDPVPYGAGEIYPTVKVRGKLYEWHKGAAIYNRIPDGYIYYNEINHISGKVPVSECDFVSAFDATGQIYISGKEDAVYIRMDADWLKSTVIVRFDR